MPHTGYVMLLAVGRPGVLDTMLVLVTGEFGLTAKIYVNNGRNHWPNCFSLVLAGPGAPKR